MNSAILVGPLVQIYIRSPLQQNPIQDKRRGLNCSQYFARSAAHACLEEYELLKPGYRQTAESKSREQLGKKALEQPTCLFHRSLQGIQACWGIFVLAITTEIHHRSDPRGFAEKVNGIYQIYRVQQGSWHIPSVPGVMSPVWAEQSTFITIHWPKGLGFNQRQNIIRQQLSIHSKKSSKGDLKREYGTTGILCYQLMGLPRKLGEISACNEKV